MKKIAFLSLLLILTNNCGFSPQGYLGHSTNTQVILDSANYRIIGSSQGSATSHFVLGFGPSNDMLYSKAKEELYLNAGLRNAQTDRSIAFINWTSDEQIRYFWFYIPFYYSKTVYVTAEIIEFLPEN